MSADVLYVCDLLDLDRECINTGRLYGMSCSSDRH